MKPIHKSVIALFLLVSLLSASSPISFAGSENEAKFSSQGDFLRSFQETRSKIRGTVIPINSGVSPIIDHIAELLIQPWIEAQYTNVQWILGDQSNRWYEVRSKWQNVIANSSVIDLFLFNHGGMDIYGLERAQHLGWKKYQLRLVYTEGCDSASSDYFSKFLSTYNAALAIGHRNTSASPFVSFPLIRHWSYGENALKATETAWSIGSIEASIVDFLSLGFFSRSLWSGRKDMLFGTVPGIGWSSEMPPEDLDISSAPTIDRNAPEKQVWHLGYVDSTGPSFDSSAKSDKLDMKDNLFRASLTKSIIDGDESPGTKHIIPKTGAIFVRDASRPNLGLAYSDSHGLIWGDALKNTSGQVDYILLDDAAKYCESLGARLPTQSEFQRLSLELGHQHRDPNSLVDTISIWSLYLLSAFMESHYSPLLGDEKTQALPNLNGNWFWTSDEAGDEPGSIFLGDSGDFSHTYYQNDFGNAVRCVAELSRR